MSYVGRVVVRVVKDGDEILPELEGLYLNRGWKHMGGDTIIENCGLSSEYAKDFIGGLCDGIYEIAGRYFEEYTQDYYGEWDGDFWLEGAKVRFLGPLEPICE